MTSTHIQTHQLLQTLGVDRNRYEAGAGIAVQSPIDGSSLAIVDSTTLEEAQRAIGQSLQAFQSWRNTPPPARGELIRLLGEELREHKDSLGQLVSLEVGKIRSEGLGEVQEMIDICDFAVGLSRQLYGKTIASERPGHRMMETWHPMGPCAVITAFNFPVAVWAWNTALALVCGNPVIWKPSEKSPLTALACEAIFQRAVVRFGDAPEGLLHVLHGGAGLGELLAASTDVAIVSATGSTRMGRAVAPVVAQRFGRCILELGGNNAMVVAPSADLDMTVRAIAFSAVGTAGQRCTSLRRLIVHQSLAPELLTRLKKAYASLSVGNPLGEGTLVGPLIDADAVGRMQDALATARAAGGTVTGGESVQPTGCEGGHYVTPALVEMPAQSDIVRTETFAPILYAMTYDTLDEAIVLNNDVSQGLSSCIFTTDIREAEHFVSAVGSDCGIANVNIGPSGAEIGGAFGGEKETGGGRESGSDAWKGYMRRATNTVNYSTELPLAQGVRFDVE
jgi:aldehyde dehydrogenase (NAD+)